jgi:hypothetical protein
MPTLAQLLVAVTAAMALLAMAADAARTKHNECKWKRRKHTCGETYSCCGDGCCKPSSHCCGQMCCKGEQTSWITTGCLAAGLVIALFVILYCGVYRRVCCRQSSRRPAPTVAEAVPSPTEMEDGVVTGEAPDAVKLKTVYGMASNEPLDGAAQAPECYGGDGPDRTFGYVSSPAKAPPAGAPDGAFPSDAVDGDINVPGVPHPASS